MARLPSIAAGRLRSLGIWGAVAALGLGALVFGLAMFYLRLEPLLAPEKSPAAALAAEFAWDTLVLTLLAIAVAVVFGQYALKQVSLAREALSEDRRAREDERRAEARRILVALFRELYHNGLVCSHKAGDLILSGDYAKRASLGFKRQTFDQVMAGPIWGSEISVQVVPSVSEAYEQLQALEVAFLPDEPWIARLGAVASTALFDNGSIKRNLRMGLVFLGVMVILDVWREIRVRRQGKPAETRQAVEAALAVIHRMLNDGQEPTWDTWDRELQPGFHWRVPPYWHPRTAQTSSTS